MGEPGKPGEALALAGGGHPAILDLRMQILDLRAQYLAVINAYAPQSAITNLKLGTRPKGGSPQDKS